MIVRPLLTLWLAPVLFFWGWYVLSANDLNFGLFVLSREMHDRTLALYSLVLGIPEEAIVPWIAKALLVDGAVVAALIAIRRRREIAALIVSRRRPQPAAPPIEDSLSSAP